MLWTTGRSRAQLGEQGAPPTDPCRCWPCTEQDSVAVTFGFRNWPTVTLGPEGLRACLYALSDNVRSLASNFWIRSASSKCQASEIILLGDLMLWIER